VDKRSFSRISFHAPVYISSGGKTYAGEIENVCHGGMFVRTIANVADGDHVLVSVNFHEGSSQLSVTMPGEVARQTTDGVGLKSPHIDTHSLIRFEYMLASNVSKREHLMEDFIDYVTTQQERHLI
jgi:Tfp pilus assembly protein PilZ